MDVKTRQRLIGFLLLLLLAAILAPLVLRSPQEVRVALDMSIPEPPPMEEPVVAPVVSDQERADTDQEISAQQQAVADAGQHALQRPKADTEAPSAPSEPPAATPPEPEPGPAQPAADHPSPGFTVQVGSFSDRANADALVARLKEADYAAYVSAVEQGGNTWQRVFVGPEIKRERAEALRQRLADDKRFALQGLVRGFVP